MATIKSHTDLQQSKKLAEILPLESADMCYMYLGTEDKEYQDIPICAPALDGDLNCWSLAALLSVLPEKYTELIKEGGMYRIIIKDSYMTCLFDNPVDACYGMILKLNEQNMI